MKKPLLSELTLREKIGQMLLPHQYHIYIDKKGSVMDFLNANEDPKYLKSDDRVKELIQKENFGVIYYEQVEMHKLQNIDMTDSAKKKTDPIAYREFLKKQASYYKIPPLIAGDVEAEGAGNLFEGCTITCRPPAIGAANSEELAYELTKSVSREIRCIGSNWRWAPVIDIGGRYAATVMRSTSPDDPERMIKLALAHIRASQEEGVAATAKHFPSGGFKGNYRDSHFCPTWNPLTFEEWWETQGVIFDAMIKGGVHSVMVGHTGFPAVDDSKVKGRYRPASVSRKIVTDLLKGKMGFGGVVITDGIPMAALLGSYDTYDELIIELVNAGNDVLLGVFPEAGNIIEKAVKDGIIAESRIDDACQRVLDMKEKIGLFEENYWDLPYTFEETVKQTARINKEIARCAITKIRDRNNLLPVDKEKVKNVTIVCTTYGEAFFKNLQKMKECFEERGICVKLQRRIESAADMARIDKESDLIIYAAYVAMHAPKGFISLYDEDFSTYRYAFTKGKEKSVAVSMGYPHLHFDVMGNADTFINTYGKSSVLMEAFVEAVLGEIPIVGESPVQPYPDHVIRRPMDENSK